MTVSDNRGATVTGSEKEYEMMDGVFTTWATVSNGTNKTYAFSVDTVVTGTESADTITITDGSEVKVDGLGGADTVTANSLINATINTGGDLINVTSGNIYASITGSSTINGAIFGTGEASVTFGEGIITVDTYTGNITADGLTVTDNRGATVSGTKSYTMTSGVFETWATVNGNTYAFAGDTSVAGTASDDTIQVDNIENVLIDGLGGVDTIIASSLTGATVNAATDLISITSGDIYANITTSSTINGAQFNGTGNANVTIGSGGITVDGFTGNITADNVTDNRGAKITDTTKAYTMTSGVFETWATINGNTYAFAGDSIANGNDSADSIFVGEIASGLVNGNGGADTNDLITLGGAITGKLSINGGAGIDTITANNLTNATIPADGDFINVTSGDIYAEITNGSTINGAQFNGTSNADVTIGSGIITVDTYSGTIVAGDNLKVSDKNGVSISGSKSYVMTEGAFSTWATINGNTYVFGGDTLATGTSGNDTINIATADKVSVNGNGGTDTIIAGSLTGSTIVSTGDFVSITSGDISIDISDNSTLNGALFTGTGNADVTIGSGIITVDGYSGNITANGLTVTDNRGATVNSNKSYEIENGKFKTWATVNGNTYSFKGDTVAVGTDSADTINITAAQNVSIDGLGGTDTITANTLTNATINASTDLINVTSGNVKLNVSDNSTLNGALFSGTSTADVTISGSSINVNSYTGNIAAGNLTITDANGLSVKSAKTYEMENGAFVTWATLNNDTYFFNIADTVVTGTDSADTINIEDAQNVSINGLGGVDTITASSLTGATITADGDFISVTSGDISIDITNASTVNGALFSGTSTADVTINGSSINVNSYSGNITANGLTVTDNRGLTVDGTRAYSISGGEFVTWATVNNESYSFAGDTLAVGTSDADTINISSAENVSIDGLGGVDTITASSLRGATVNASTDYISVTAGDIHASIATDSTINGATFTGNSNADITISGSNASVDAFTGDIVAGTLTVYDKNGRAFTGSRVYSLEDGELTSWATINGDTYVLFGETVASGTAGNDTIQISSIDKVSINGLAGIDTITADSLTGATVNASTDYISIAGGDIYASIETDSTINGALFSGSGYTGNITANDLTITDKRGSTVKGAKSYIMEDGAFTSWATVNGNSYVFLGDSIANGTDSDDTIIIASASKVLVDGKGGIDTITADSLSGATVNASTDLISIAGGDIYASIETDSTINGALFTGTSDAEINIGDGIITVDGYTGNITANDLTITDKRGSTVKGAKS